jgi:UDP-N-acetylglucosamine acyltransferase
MAVIGEPPPGAEADGQCILGEANAVREHVTIFAGPEAPTRIGNHNLIMIASQIGAGAVIGDHGIFDNCSRIGPGAVIEDYVRMSGFAAVSEGVRVGAYSFVAGYAGVQRDAPPYAMLQGFPVRVRGLNTRNLKACGFGEGDIHELKNAFRELFGGRDGTANRKALKRLEASARRNRHVRKLLEAVRDGAGGKADADE